MAEELTDVQIDELAADLRALQIELTKVLADMRSSGSAVDLDQPIGRLSRVDAMQRQQMVVANRRRAEQRLKQVRAALARIKSDGESPGAQTTSSLAGQRRQRDERSEERRRPEGQASSTAALKGT